jgi:hypothetical protein
VRPKEEGKKTTTKLSETINNFLTVLNQVLCAAASFSFFFNFSFYFFALLSGGARYYFNFFPYPFAPLSLLLM